MGKNSFRINLLSVWRELLVANRLMTVSPFRQTIIDVILIRIHQSSRRNRRGNHRTNGFLLHIVQHSNCNLSAALDHSEYGRFFFVQCAPSASTFQTAAPTFTVFFSTASGCPLCPASTYTSSHSTSPWSFACGFRVTTPWRSCLAISWTSLILRSNSRAIWLFDKFNPMKYNRRSARQSQNRTIFSIDLFYRVKCDFEEQERHGYASAIYVKYAYILSGNRAKTFT